MRKFKELSSVNSYAINDLADVVVIAGIAITAINREHDFASKPKAIVRGGILTELAARLSKEGK